MGFNLKMFFEELNRIMSMNIDEEDRMIRLQKCMTENQEYAKRCGHI